MECTAMKRFAVILIILMLLFTSSAQAMLVIHQMDGFICRFPVSATFSSFDKKAGETYVMAMWHMDGEDGPFIGFNIIWIGKKYNITVKKAESYQKNDKKNFYAERKKAGDEVYFYNTYTPYKTTMFGQDCIVSISEESYNESGKDRYYKQYRIYFGAKGYEFIIISDDKDAIETLMAKPSFPQYIDW